jgi:RimJ/RimL family protein N-acetyltransferase
MIVPAARGRNLAARALAVALDDAFDRKNARRIVADIDPDNAASIRTFEKLGFTLEARLRGEWEMHIGIRDSLIYGLLRDDPRPWRVP